MRAFDDVALLPPQGSSPTRPPAVRQPRRFQPIRRKRRPERPHRWRRRRRSSLQVYLSIVGPSQVVLTRRLAAGSEASLWATAWKGRQRLFPRFEFVSSGPGIVRVVDQGSDWVSVRGVSQGRATITATTAGARASIFLTVVPSAA